MTGKVIPAFLFLALCFMPDHTRFMLVSTPATAHSTPSPLSISQNLLLPTKLRLTPPHLSSPSVNPESHLTSHPSALRNPNPPPRLTIRIK
ncbi:hypothetical protein BV22DRAFT_1031809 [Leucogyrophana mollusca]|uniref:Uncharacterized protein n=1 Tax=Leucogyrophana mollusca TaxID=85980 RepID=A0ACB8BPA9_9AGAM|nr:hypothetical protein BV22DRAFT_1031809 [Leucogyrophana mollusca]